MLKTRITEAFGLDHPVINAGMAFVAGPELAAAVANAGGLGMLGTGMTPPEGLRSMIHVTVASLTGRSVSTSSAHSLRTAISMSSSKKRCRSWSSSGLRPRLSRSPD